MKVENRMVLGDFVYDHIKELILTRKINCGERINEQLIEEDLGVSRTPVREAVRRLSNEGIATLVPNRFTEVITFTEDSIRELGMVRITMDCLSAQLAIQNGSNRDFDELSVLVQKCHDANQEENWYEQIKYDSEFHFRLIQISGNSLLIDLQKNIMLKTRLLQTERLDKAESSLCDLEQHQAILDGLYVRDLDQVLAAIKKHLAPFYLLDDTNIKVITFS